MSYPWGSIGVKSFFIIEKGVDMSRRVFTIAAVSWLQQSVSPSVLPEMRGGKYKTLAPPLKLKG